MGKAGKATSPIAKPLPSSINVRQMSDQEKVAVATLERERRHLQERARLHLNEMVAEMMQSDDPAIWQPLFIAATSEWQGHNLLNDDDNHHRNNEEFMP
jgi:hypothetical protein